VLARDLADPAYGARFVREARVASRVIHPNVARVLDLGRTRDGLVFSVMEHLSGEDLEQRLAHEGAMPWSHARRILRQVIRGLEAAHAIGVIHRDVKPSNVFLVDADGDRPPVVKVLDFGIAKSSDPTTAFGQPLTLIGKLIGTAEYMAPERVMGEPADARSDIYSLGVMMFEMLTGQPPWEPEASAMRTLMRRVREPPPELPGFLPGVPAEVVELVRCAMARDPEDRFPSLHELGAALRAVPAGGGVRLLRSAVPARVIEGRWAQTREVSGPLQWKDTLTWEGPARPWAG
jgi:eukaryotic-like serine/threonine-protein kinase